MTPVIALINNMAETSRAVQWLGLWAGGAGSIPGLVGELRPKFHMLRYGQKKKRAEVMSHYLREQLEKAMQLLSVSGHSPLEPSHHAVGKPGLHDEAPGP